MNKEPNAETIEAFQESDRMVVKENLKYIFDHIVKTTEGFVIVNSTPGLIKKSAGEALDLLNNPLQEVTEVESVEELNTDKLEDLVMECNRLKRILHNSFAGMSNLDFIILSDAIRRAENSETGDNIVIETPDDVRRILKVKIEKIEHQIRRLVNNEKSVDTELLDFLQQELDKAAYTGKVVCRKSTTGRGWRLLETSGDGAVSDVRQAIMNYMEQVKK